MASVHKYQLQSRRNGKPVTRYRVRWRLSGGVRSRSFPTLSQAQTFAAQAEVGIDEAPGTVAATAPPQAPTVQACVDAWNASRRVSAARTAAERSLVRRFGSLLERPVDTVKPTDVRRLVAQLVDAGLAAETVSAILRTLRAVLDTALEDGHIPSNPAARIKPPRIVRPPLDAEDVYTASEAAALVAATPERHRALVAVLVFTGARWSEAAAITRQDVDLMRGRVHFGHRVVEEVSGRSRIRRGGKTRGSDRWVPLPGPVRQALSDHLAAFQPAPDELLFGTTADTPILRGNTTKRVYRPAVEAAAKAGLLRERGITVRNLRHTAASMMLAAGLPPLEVAHRLGHSRPSTTLDVYARFIPSSDGASNALLDSFLAGGHGTSMEHQAGSRA